MSTFKARGIVIKEAVKGEADKVLTLFCKEVGKITLYAKGAMKPKSKYLMGSQLFTYSDFVVYDGKAFLSVTQIDVIESFYNIRIDYDRFYAGNRILETLNKILYPGVQSDNLLLLLLKACSALSSGKIPPELVRIVFEMKLLEYEGYMPELSVCSACGNKIFTPFHLGMNGLVCAACLKRHFSVKISETALYTVKHILSTGVTELFAFTVSENVLDELKKVCNLLMKSHFEGVV